MPTPIEVYDAIERHLGLSTSRARQYAQRLREGDEFASGAPGKSPDIQVEDVVSLVIAVAIDGPVYQAAETVRAYRNLTPGGASLDGAPAYIGTAGDYLDAWAKLVIEDKASVLRRDQIEIDTAFPAITIHAANGTKRFQPVGSVSGHWESKGHRRAVTISGAALADALVELFPKGSA